MLRLKLYPNEFKGMISFLWQITQGQQNLDLVFQNVAMLVLLDYRASWKHHRLSAWLDRRADKLYLLNLPLSVAKALHQAMPESRLEPDQQLFLNKLDQAVVSHRAPSRPFLLGELV
ncbi:hypothetical protein [Spirosoma fluminis]